MAIKNFTSIYNTNPTMQILGQQNICGIIGSGAIGCNDFKNVIKAYKTQGTTDLYNIASDAFSLGFIYGKKADRAQRQHKEIKPLTEELTAEQIAAKLTAKPYLLEFMQKVAAAELEPAQLSYLMAFVKGL